MPCCRAHVQAFILYVFTDQLYCLNPGSSCPGAQAEELVSLQMSHRSHGQLCGQTGKWTPHTGSQRWLLSESLVLLRPLQLATEASAAAVTLTSTSLGPDPAGPTFSSPRHSWVPWGTGVYTVPTLTRTRSARRTEVHLLPRSVSPLLTSMLCGPIGLHRQGQHQRQEDYESQDSDIRATHQNEAFLSTGSYVTESHTDEAGPGWHVKECILFADGTWEASEVWSRGNGMKTYEYM